LASWPSTRRLGSARPPTSSTGPTRSASPGCSTPSCTSAAGTSRSRARSSA
jgi:hypothetical protein